MNRWFYRQPHMQTSILTDRDTMYKHNTVRFTQIALNVPCYVIVSMESFGVF